jgi:hypothetical protein
MRKQRRRATEHAGVPRSQQPSVQDREKHAPRAGRALQRCLRAKAPDAELRTGSAPPAGWFQDHVGEQSIAALRPAFLAGDLGAACKTDPSTVQLGGPCGDDACATTFCARAPDAACGAVNR